MSADTAIQPYIPMIKGVIALFAPFVEVAIHDVTTGKITVIYNNITNRKVGDLSPVTELGIPVEKFPDFFEPYYETNWDGRKIKCTTITVRNEQKQPVALICLNFDVSVFENMQFNLKTFLEVKENTANPVELYSGNWQERIDSLISNYVSAHKLILGNLSREQKQALVEELSHHGIFFLKNAAPYVANKLHISRATVYNYLKVLRAE
jgi:predicted transcriptional regulator YheO